MRTNLSSVLLILLTLSSCGGSSRSSNNETKKEIVSIRVPDFNADSAYHYTATQVGFGPRVPNTLPHEKCAQFFVNKLKEFGAHTIVQEANLSIYDGTLIKAKNIIASFQPENKARILLFAHWDTRPFSDHDPDPVNYRKPIDGANDGAGACAVLLEIARQIGIKQPNIGVDIILFDAEDWGPPDFDTKYQTENGWCLGSEYWSKNPHVANYTARFGILLDMVSAPNARFYKEYFSVESAAHIVKKVWDAAQVAGYGPFFINEDNGAIMDDHVQVIRNRKIPCIDIIDHDPQTTHGFGKYWHTQADNMEHVSKETLQAAGQTILQVVYHEK